MVFLFFFPYWIMTVTAFPGGFSLPTSESRYCLHFLLRLLGDAVRMQELYWWSEPEMNVVIRITK